MKKYLLGACVTAAWLACSTWAWSEGWEAEDEHRSPAVAQQTQHHAMKSARKDYRKECSACHMAYPAEFLPARSWAKIMGNLDKHFGENAELDPEDQRDIAEYLNEHASDHSRSRMARWITRSISPQRTPLRISETHYFERIHDEVPERLVRNNPKVRSFSNCMACHRGASEGDFDEDRVVIPGARRWDD